MSKTKRIQQHNRITPEVVAQFKALELLLGNGSAAVRVMTPTIRNVGDRAYQLRKKSELESTETYIDSQLQSIAVDAVNRIGELVASPNETIATKNSHYAVDHIRGQATKKSIALTGKLNIQNILD